uniref:Uncharacterized protein n=1 Tax=Nicotiana tabacum TaxID=4097 RepID=A0A1S3ZZ92_TOBAC|nr:PREDICTED: uncharacterized protein LOC107792011 [Nicotiana tabacum]
MATASFSSLGSFPNSLIFSKISSSSSSSTLGQRQIVCTAFREPNVDLPSSSDGNEISDCRAVVDRREVLLSSVGFLAVAICNAGKAAEFADSNVLSYISTFYFISIFSYLSEAEARFKLDSFNL